MPRAAAPSAVQVHVLNRAPVASVALVLVVRIVIAKSCHLFVAPVYEILF